MSSNSYNAARAENSFELNGGPLSLWNVSGIPCRAKRFFNFPITAAPVFALCSSITVVECKYVAANLLPRALWDFMAN